MEYAKQEKTLASGDIVKFETDISGDAGAFMLLTITHQGGSLTSKLTKQDFQDLQKKGYAVFSMASV
jgi:hypothetical protein